MAVLFRDGVECSMLRVCLGSEEHHTVFEAELLGLSLAVELVKSESHVQTVTIGADSQAAILATRHDRGTPGQYLVDGLYEQIAAAQCMHPRISIELRWTSGHEGIAGNERADEEAKLAAKGKSSGCQQLPRICRQELPLSWLAA